MAITLFNTSSDADLVPSGTVLFTRGDPATVMYVVVAGCIEIDVDGTVIDRVEGGGVVGEMALVSAAPRSATARASLDTRVVAIDRARFSRLVSQTPFFALQIMEIMADRLRRRMGAAEEVAAQ